MRARQGAPDDHVLVPHRRARPLPLAVLRARAPPASSSASAGRCRRSATWTGSSTSSEPSERAESHPPDRRPLDRREPDRDAARDLGARAAPAAGAREQAGGRAGHRQHGPDRGAHAGDLPDRRLLRLRADRLPPARPRDRGGRGDPRQRAGADDLDRRHLRDRALPRRVRHLVAAPERLGRRPGPVPIAVPKRPRRSRCR